MRPVMYAGEQLREAFEAAKVMTLQMILEVLGGPTRMTAFRKLDALDYRASYSHGGQYYTLNEIAEYDKRGLWTFEAVHFSMYGSLLDTLEHLVSISSEGYFARELHALVHVRVHNALAKLHRDGRLGREELGGEFLYLSRLMGQTQLQRREQRVIQSTAEPASQRQEAFGSVTVQQKLQVLLSALNEKQKRLYLGFESLKLGHGGDVRIARISGVDVKTIARGRAELQAENIDMDRIRQPGAGRPSVKKNRGDRTAE
jgi:hypothetical protein